MFKEQIRQGKLVFARLSALPFAYACGLIFVVAAGCGPKPELSSENQALGTQAESAFSVSYRRYLARLTLPMKFEDLIPSRHVDKIERRNERDYQLDVFREPGTLQKGLTLTLIKLPTNNEDDITVDMVFRIPADSLEPGRIYDCAFTPSREPDSCTVFGDVRSQSLRERLFLPSGVRSPALRCRIQLSHASLEISTRTLATRTLRLPARKGTLDGNESFAFGFQCQDTRNRLSALQGYFLQNTRSVPVFPAL